jgi:hypothetical protein
MNRSAFNSPSIVRSTLTSLILSWGTLGFFASLSHPISAQAATPPVYQPIPLMLGQELKDVLSDRDIPTGQGGFARDYMVTLKAGDQIAVDLVSEVFDPMIVLMTKEGTPIAENDDGPDGTPNALLFTRIVKPGNYIIRVRSFGETAGGAFRLTVTPLKSIP